SISSPIFLSPAWARSTARRCARRIGKDASAALRERGGVCQAGPGPALRRHDPAGSLKMLRDDINAHVKEAMKARDERRLSTLRMINSAIKNADIDARGQGKAPLSDD